VNRQAPEPRAAAQQSDEPVYTAGNGGTLPTATRTDRGRDALHAQMSAASHAPAPAAILAAMGTSRLSEDLIGELQSLRRHALELQSAATSPFLKQRLDMALLDLDEIPRLFDSEEYMRQALIVPRARINEVARTVERFGPNAPGIDQE